MSTVRGRDATTLTEWKRALPFCDMGAGWLVSDIVFVASEVGALLGCQMLAIQLCG